MKLLVPCMALFALLPLFYGMGFRLNLTPSMPRGLYRLSQASPQRGDMVSFCLSGPWAELAAQRCYVGSGSCPSGLRPLLKTLAGLPGDRLQRTPEGISIHTPGSADMFWPAPARHTDAHGRALPAGALSPGVIPDGMALVLADHPGSFDSRFFGLVPSASLSKANPVFTF